MPIDVQARMVTLAAKGARLVELAGVDLGEEREVYDWEVCKPASTKPKNLKKMYPALSIYRTPADLASVPDSGKATIDYKVVKRTKRVDDQGKTTHDYEIEIRSLDPIAEKDTKQPVKGKIATGVPVMGSAKMMLSDARASIGFGRGDILIERAKKNLGIMGVSGVLTAPNRVPVRGAGFGERNAVKTAATFLRGENQGVRAKRVAKQADMKKYGFLSARLAGILEFSGSRNSAGEFAPTDSSTFTPAQATAAYGHPKDRAGMGAQILQRAIESTIGARTSAGGQF